MTEEPQVNEWQAPPPPEMIQKEEPEMSEVATLFNIFIEPGRTFEDLRKKPRFIMATIIIALLITAFYFGLYYKIGDEGYRQFANEQVNKQSPDANAEAREMSINIQMISFSVARYGMPIIIIIIVAIGGLIYWLSAKAFGGSGNFLHAVSVWVYSTLPPLIIASIANVIVFIFKSAEEIELATAQQQATLVQVNPGFFMDGKAMPVLTTLISVIDLFAIWGWILAAIGLQKTNKLSSGSAWAVTLIIASIGIIYRIIVAYFSGNPS